MLGRCGSRARMKTREIWSGSDGHHRLAVCHRGKLDSLTMYLINSYNRMGLCRDGSQWKPMEAAETVGSEQSHLRTNNRLQ